MMRSGRRPLSHVTSNVKSGLKSSNKSKKSQTRRGKRKRGRRLLYTRFRSEPEPTSGSPPRTPPSSDDEDSHFSSNGQNNSSKLTEGIGGSKPHSLDTTLSMTSEEIEGDWSRTTSASSLSTLTPRGGSRQGPSPSSNNRSRQVGKIGARMKPSATVAPVPNPQTSSSSMNSSRDRRGNDQKKRQARRHKQRTQPSETMSSRSRGNVMYVAKNSHKSTSKLDGRIEEEEVYVDTEEMSKSTKSSSSKRKGRKEVKKRVVAPRQFRKRSGRPDKKSPPVRKPKKNPAPRLTTAKAPPRPEEVRKMDEKVIVQSTVTEPPLVSPVLSAADASSITSASNLSSLGLTPKASRLLGSPKSRWSMFYDSEPQKSKPSSSMRDPPQNIFTRSMDGNDLKPSGNLNIQSPTQRFFVENPTTMSSSMYCNRDHEIANSRSECSRPCSDSDEDTSSKMSSHSQRHYIPHHVRPAADYYRSNYVKDSPVGHLPHEYSRVTDHQQAEYYNLCGPAASSAAGGTPNVVVHSPYQHDDDKTSYSQHPYSPEYAKQVAAQSAVHGHFTHHAPFSSVAPPPPPPYPPAQGRVDAYSSQSSTITDGTFVIPPQIEEGSECSESSGTMLTDQFDQDVQNNGFNSKWTGYEMCGVHNPIIDTQHSQMKQMNHDLALAQVAFVDEILIQGAHNSFSALESLGGEVYSPMTDCQPNGCKPIERSGSVSPSWFSTLMSGLSFAPAVACLYDAGAVTR